MPIEHKEDEYSCIKYIDNTEDEEKWKALRTMYRKKLDDGPTSTKIKYTPHNYSEHCVNIYKNISDLLVDFSKTNFKKHEIYLLNVAVLLHDITMAYNPQMRSVHPNEARKYIKQEVNKRYETALGNVLAPDDADIIADIIYGHGDLKLESVKINTLEELSKQYIEQNSEINKLKCQMAAILRLADELDATQSRENKSYNAHGFDMNDPDDIESEKHHRKLYLIEKIEQDRKKVDRLFLYFNDTFFEEEGEQERDIDLVIEVKNKIKSEMNNVYENVISKIEDTYFRYFRDIIIKSASGERYNILNNEKKRNRVLLVDADMSEYLYNVVKNENLLSIGNYRINEEICAREWIDIEKLLDNTEVFYKIMSKLIEKTKKILNSNNQDEVIILGIGINGIKMGSVLANAVGCIFTYCMPIHLKDLISAHDIQISCIKRKVIIVTDVIASFNTINEIIVKSEIKYENILRILSIFGRKLDKEYIKQDFDKITEYMNTNIPINLIPKDECQIRNLYGKCKCENLPVDVI